MGGLAGISFLLPGALAALAALPLIYWLLRFVPPQPQNVKFPPFRLLLDLVSKNEQADKTPLWLVILRLLLASAVIIAIAQPVIVSPNGIKINDNPALIIIDNDWSTAPDWQTRLSLLQQTIEKAQIKGVPVALITSTDQNALTPTMQNAETALERAKKIIPQPLKSDRAKLIKTLKTNFGKLDTLQIIWLSNGRTAPRAPAKADTKTRSAQPQDFAAALKSLAKGKAELTIATTSPNALPLILSAPTRKDGKIIATIHRATTKTMPANITKDEKSAGKTLGLKLKLLARNGRNLAQVPLNFKPGQKSATASIALPLALRNEAASLQLGGQSHAGAIFLIDDQWRRKSIGIITSQSLELAQPLLSPLYYVTRALAPTAAINQPEDQKQLDQLLKTGLSMLVMADIGNMPTRQHRAIAHWVRKGGVLVRFAGPRLAEQIAKDRYATDDPLIPVRLRGGGRALGSALSWEKPQALATFAPQSPLAGLRIEKDVTVKRQVLAEPTADLSGRVWASLEDGTPLITASKQGNGLVVLVHVTANTDWSNLPLSGMFVKILERILSLAPAVTSNETEPTGSTQVATDNNPFIATANLDGFGRLGPANLAARPIKAKDFAKTTPAPSHPPGLYKSGARTAALNLSLTPEDLLPLSTRIKNVHYADYKPAPGRNFTGWFFGLAAILFLLDSLAVLFLMGGINRLVSRRIPSPAGTRLNNLSGVLILFALGIAGLAQAANPTASLAQQSDNTKKTSPDAATLRAMEAVQQTRFAYVLTGNNEVDATSLAGLNGLNTALRQRTSVEPGRPHAIDLEKDEIVFYPLLYWPVLANAKPPSEKVAAKLRAFMKNGGTIFFDTRDQAASFAQLTTGTSPQTRALRRILDAFDIPALEPVPPRHVLTRAFYLLQQFPGRWMTGKLWVEAASTDKSQTDGVSSIIIGANDYAAAWAIDLNGSPLYPTIPGTPRQREFAYRTGINIVMYTLTGNYKADQVHVPALLRRLGQ